MARPIYAHEAMDPDFQWLLNNYRLNHPNTTIVDHSCVPIVLLLIDERAALEALSSAHIPPALPAGDDPIDESDPMSDDT